MKQAFDREIFFAAAVDPVPNDLVLHVRDHLQTFKPPQVPPQPQHARRSTQHGSLLAIAEACGARCGYTERTFRALSGSERQMRTQSSTHRSPYQQPSTHRSPSHPTSSHLHTAHPAILPSIYTPLTQPSCHPSTHRSPSHPAIQPAMC